MDAPHMSSQPMTEPFRLPDVLEVTVPQPSLQTNFTLMPGAYVDPHALIEAEVVIGPNAVVLSQPPEAGVPTSIHHGAQIGGNVTIYPGVTIGAKATVAPGSVVKRSVPPLAIVEGNPALITGYVETPEVQSKEVNHHALGAEAVVQSRVKGVTFHSFLQVADLRGNLTVGDFSREIPFIPKRYFLVFDVPTAETRGEHAHLRCAQFLIAVKGSVSVVVDDGHGREEFLLNRPNMGIYLPPMTWGIQYRYSADAVLLVFASDHYDPADYVRDYDQFLDLIRASAKPG